MGQNWGVGGGVFKQKEQQEQRPEMDRAWLVRGSSGARCQGNTERSQGMRSEVLQAPRREAGLPSLAREARVGSEAGSQA